MEVLNGQKSAVKSIWQACVYIYIYIQYMSIHIQKHPQLSQVALVQKEIFNINSNPINNEVLVDLRAKRGCYFR